MSHKKNGNEDEDKNFKILKTKIEALTHSGSNILDEEVFKDIKKICKYVQQTMSFNITC